MGLDMYAFSVNKQIPPVIDKDLDLGEEQPTQIAYWRKHPNLHGWMEQLYRKKGGQAEAFNVVGVEVTAADLDELEKAVQGDLLPPTDGFFFGQSSPEDKADDLAFIDKAREELAAGRSCFYTSWW